MSWDVYQLATISLVEILHKAHTVTDYLPLYISPVVQYSLMFVTLQTVKRMAFFLPIKCTTNGVHTAFSSFLSSTLVPRFKVGYGWFAFPIMILIVRGPR